MQEANKTYEVDQFLHNSICLQILAQLYAVHRLDMRFLRTVLNLTLWDFSFQVTKLEGKGYLIMEKTHIGKKIYTLLQITAEGKLQFEQYKIGMQSFLQ